MLESEFQNKLIQELKKMFKGCIVTKLDSSHIQGIPDLLILYNNKWATLECKKSVRAKKQPPPGFSRRKKRRGAESRLRQNSFITG